MFYEFAAPLLLTLLSEIPLAMLLFQRKDILFFLFAFGLNLVTNLSLNFFIVLSSTAINYLLTLVLGEIIVYAFEYLAYAIFTRKWKFSLIVSFLANSLSLGLGLVMNQTIEKGADIRIYTLVFLFLLFIGLVSYFVYSVLLAKREAR